MNEVGFENIQKRTWIVRLWNKRLLEIEGLKIFGTAKRKPLWFHLTLKAFIPMILAIIDKLGIAVRTGHHCATDYDFSIFRNNTSFFSFTIPKKKSTLWLKRWKEQHSCCLNNLNDENTIFTTIDCFSWKSCEGQNKQI
jgi:hypothetical protein